MRLIAALWLSLVPIVASAQDASRVLDTILDTHVAPRYAALTQSTESLVAASQDTCTPTAPTLREAYHDAFDAWIGISHLRFGPASVDDRVFALAFWPDSRGVTPKSLAQLIRDRDPVIETADAFSTVSVAARGFYALEFLLFDDATIALAESDYGCALIQRVSADIHQTVSAIANEWQTMEAPAMRAAASEGRYTSANDALLAFYAALNEGMEFTIDLRLGRPMGTFERPRPRRAETRRSERSLRNVQLSIESLGDLAGLMGAVDGADQQAIEAAFAEATTQAEDLDDPVFAGVANPTGRFAVELVQQRTADALEVAQVELAPALGATLTFNSLDGD